VANTIVAQRRVDGEIVVELCLSGAMPAKLPSLTREEAAALGPLLVMLATTE
jgi:hypothetical protein